MKGHEQIDDDLKIILESEFVKQFMGSHLEDDAPCVEENAIIRDLDIMKPIDEVTSMRLIQLFMTINQLKYCINFYQRASVSLSCKKIA